MRFTNQLCQQHLGFMFKKHWLVQGKQVVRDTGAQAALMKHNIEVVDAKDVITVKHLPQKIDIVGYMPVEPSKDENHPHWHDTQCHVYGNNNVLLEGIPQAQVLLKTIEIKNLPKSYNAALEKIKSTRLIDRNVQNAILASHCFDTQQEKTAIVKVPERPAFVLPRNYGITDNRKNRLILSKLLHECEKLAGRSTSSQRHMLENAEFAIHMKREGDLLQLDLSAERLITSKRAIEPIKENIDDDLPDIYPLLPTITIPKTNIYKIENSYPVPKTIQFSNPHTVYLHFSPLDVKNVHETSVTDSQFYARTLMKAFSAAAARAKQAFGESVADLPQPIVIQAVQTDGKYFHFGVFQLNTLDLTGTEGRKNYWFHIPKINLFEECSYKVGRPVLEGYNSEIFKYMSVFYNS